MLMVSPHTGVIVTISSSLALMPISPPPSEQDAVHPCLTVTEPALRPVRRRRKRRLEGSEAWLELYASSADPESLLEHDHSMDG